jgi:hypothetical protein
MKFKHLLILFAFIGTLASCNKNNSNLEIIGSWNRIQMTTENNGTVNEVDIPEENILNFENCEGNNDWCPSSATYDGVYSQSQYQVSEDGDILTIQDVNGSQQQVYSINELNSTTLKISSSGQGGNLTITYEKL